MNKLNTIQVLRTAVNFYIENLIAPSGNIDIYTLQSAAECITVLNYLEKNNGPTS